MPGDRPGTVLLERYGFALVPHGPWLLEQLLHPAGAQGQRLLAVGGLGYEPEREWAPLPGTGREIARLAPPLTIDNMEGVSVTVENGRNIVWLVSDDNFFPLQRTLLLKFALVE